MYKVLKACMAAQQTCWIDEISCFSEIRALQNVIGDLYSGQHNYKSGDIATLEVSYWMSWVALTSLVLKTSPLPVLCLIYSFVQFILEQIEGLGAQPHAVEDPCLTSSWYPWVLHLESQPTSMIVLISE